MLFLWSHESGSVVRKGCNDRVRMTEDRASLLESDMGWVGGGRAMSVVKLRSVRKNRDNACGGCLVLVCSGVGILEH